MIIRASGSANGPIVDSDEIRRALSVFADPDKTIQLFGIPGYQHANCSGRDADGFVRAATQLSSSARNIYFVINPLAGVPVRTEPIHGPRATKKDVAYRRWIFLDIDPLKPPEHQGDPATDEEHDLARQQAESVRRSLAARDWPAPVVVDSGNGWYLFYRTDLENSPLSDSLVRAFVYSLAQRLNKDSCGKRGKIDCSIHDAPRLAKLPGTLAQKGKASKDRPFRPCRFVDVPAHTELVTAEMLASWDASSPLPITRRSKAFVLRAGSRGATAYIARVLDLECARVALAHPGERNNALNRAAFALGTLVGGGYLARALAESRLREAVTAWGLS